MLLKKFYDKKTKTEKAWYDSSMFCYTKAVEYDDKNAVDLYVTFKNGATYKYKEVKLEDYVLLIAGVTEASQGKTLNKLIKPNYEVEKVEPLNISEVWDEFNKTTKKDSDKNNTIFISGHRDITEQEFEYNYTIHIDYEIEQNPDIKFVIGDYEGCDIMAQNYLVNVINFNPDNITVYHMKDTPQNINEKIANTIGGFESDEERDAAMTEASYKDIAFVRDNTKWSGTAQNILRRFLFI